MDKIPDSYRSFWEYISQTQKDLILEGNYLMNDVIRHANYHFKDYSFLVFPYAKAYEGFLKQLLYDAKFLNHLDYISTHLRLGKLLSPNLIEKLGDRSLYKKIQEKASPEIAEKIWQTWKVGRNEIFHYFAHNNKMITFQDAEKITGEIISTMAVAYEKLKVQSQKSQVTVENH